VLPQTILARLHQTVTLAGRGDAVVVAGGVVWAGTRWSPVDRVDVYDVAHRSWRAGAPLTYARSDGAAVTLRDGRVAVFGGNLDTRLLGSVEIYDLARDTWTTAAPMPRPRTQHTAVLLRDGKVMVMGGIDTDGGPTDSTFVYDPSADSWDYGPRMNEARFQQATVPLRGGDFLLIGGDGLAAGTSERYVASQGRFVRSGVLTVERLVAQAAALPDGRVVVTGGLPLHMTSYRPLVSVEVWDPATGVWTEVAPLKEPRAWGTLLRVDHALYLVSGTGTDQTALGTVEKLSID
jgi:N-acetylneuraminic acid mutarotase